MKIALIGQDIPTLLPTLLTDLLFVGRQSAALALEEKNAAMQDVLQRYGDAVIRDAQHRYPGLTASLTVTGSRREALAGADCVIYAGDCMAASRFKMDREALSGVEEDDPGLLEQARVNGGIGGLMHTLRQGETVLDLCESMQNHCPGAIVVNLGQPVARTTLIFERKGFRCYGLGRTPLRGANGLDSLTKKLNCKPEDVKATIAGLPGFAFLVGLEDAKNQDDLLPLLYDLAQEDSLGQLTRRWLDWYGAIAIGDVTDHAEWLPAQDDYIPEEEPVFGETVERRKERILWMNTVGEKGAEEQEGKMAQILLLSKAVPIRPMQLALALLRDEDCDIPAVTRLNNGELPQLAKSAMIEAELSLRAGQIVPHGTLLPAPLAEICGEIDETNRLAAQAAAGDRIALRECIEIDPALAGLDRLYVQDVVDKMIEMHADVLGRFDEEEE
ncbi:MAG: hypothetical protein IJZ74_04495 [Clostridia bacterium]|nr:hypothetical protein [Clostridia bacterium]